jgi:hypothetical protein
MGLSMDDLKPGDRVINNISQNVGVVREDPTDPKKLAPHGAGYVPVRVRVGDQRRQNRFWLLTNIRLATDQERLGELLGSLPESHY